MSRMNSLKKVSSKNVAIGKIHSLTLIHQLSIYLGNCLNSTQISVSMLLKLYDTSILINLGDLKAHLYPIRSSIGTGKRRTLINSPFHLSNGSFSRKVQCLTHCPRRREKVLLKRHTHLLSQEYLPKNRSKKKRTSLKRPSKAQNLRLLETFHLPINLMLVKREVTSKHNKRTKNLMNLKKN